MMIDYVTFERGTDRPIQHQPDDAGATCGKVRVIQVHPDIELQTLLGVGGAFNENGGEALLSLPADTAQNLLENLFAAEHAFLSFNRTPVGASDFALDAYSYSMVPEDYNMDHFSIDRDKKYLLPFIKRAMAVNPAMRMQASPWSPPAWMKRNGVMDKNDICDPADASLRNAPSIYEAYATYMVKYIQAYAAEGVNIDTLCIQNEPDTYQPFPGCWMSIQEMHLFLKKYLRPAFNAVGLGTELWAGTIRALSDRFDHLELIQENRIADFDGMGVQYFSASYLKELYGMQPSLKLIHTEGECCNGDNSPEQAKRRLPEIAGYINGGCKSFCYWNMILNEESTSAWGWKQNSLVTIDRTSGKVAYNPDYNVMYLVGQTLKPGDIRIAHGASWVLADSLITLKSPDGTVKILAQNNDDKPMACDVVLNGRRTRVVLPPESACRIIL